MDQDNFVFGYGSLVNLSNLERYLGRELILDVDFFICGLHNYRRCWNVAMNNNLDLPNYKYYRDRISGNRPNYFVTFINIRSAQDNTIFGILFKVSPAELENLDQRERNYHRIDITNELNINIEGKAWTYLGLASAKQRYQTGLQKHSAVISSNYFNLVRDAYFSLGDRYWHSYMATTDQPEIPIVDLEVYRVNKLNI